MKTLGFILILLAFQPTLNAQQKTDSLKTALLLVDIQNFYFPEYGPGLVNADAASLAAKEVLQICRDRKQLIVHVKHKSDKASEIHQNVSPLPGEQVFTKTDVSSFVGTGLSDYLKSKKINRLIIIGMQTHMCMEAAVRAAHDLGYECVVIEDACATKDLKTGDKVVKAADVQAVALATITAGGYGKVIDLKTFRENPDRYLNGKLP